jgi:hypothetical protein
VHRGYPLFWVWALKPFFVDDAVRLAPFGASDHYFWADAGLLRHGHHSGRDIRSLQPPRIVMENPRMTFIGCPFPLAPAKRAAATAAVTAAVAGGRAVCGGAGLGPFAGWNWLAGGVFGGHRRQVGCVAGQKIVFAKT